MTEFERPGILLYIASNVLEAWDIINSLKPVYLRIIPPRILNEVLHCSLFNWDALNSRNGKCSDDASSHFLFAVSNSLNYNSNNFFLLINKYLLLYITYFRASLYIIKINITFLVHTKIIQRRFFIKFWRFTWTQGP